MSSFQQILAVVLTVLSLATRVTGDIPTLAAVIAQQTQYIDILYTQSLYRLYLELGSTDVEYYAGLDTGSPKTWLGYHPDDTDDYISATNLTDQLGPMDITYVDGSHYQGPVWGDSMMVPSHNATEDGVLRYTQDIEYGAMDTLDNVIRALSGIVGLWPQPDGKQLGQQAEFLIDAFSATDDQNRREFAFYLPRKTCGYGARGLWTLGGRDTTKFTDIITTVPRASTPLGWSVSIDGIYSPVDGTLTTYSQDESGSTIDIGADGLLAKLQFAIQFHQMIADAKIVLVNGSSVLDESLNSPDGLLDDAWDQVAGTPIEDISTLDFAVPCNVTQAEIPSLMINGRSFAVRPEDLAMDDHDPFFGQTNPTLTLIGMGLCRSSLQGRSGIGAWLLGQPWMRSFYTIFNYGDNTPNGNGASITFGQSIPTDECPCYNGTNSDGTCTDLNFPPPLA